MTTIELIRQRLLLPIMLWILHGCIQEINQLAMEYIINSIMRKVHNYHNNLLKLCILTHKNPISRLGGVTLTRYIDGRIDGHTTDGRTDRVIPMHPQTLCAGGIHIVNR
jgi:hypothetical protein